jgi:hypothetical protein
MSHVKNIHSSIQSGGVSKAEHSLSVLLMLSSCDTLKRQNWNNQSNLINLKKTFSIYNYI